jgi:DNA-binding CsgD family transcriptional regulator/anti-sigma regulatory factor (Ser/Thr protein kinase)
MIGDRLHQAADVRNEVTEATRKSGTVQRTIVAATEPAAGRARDPIVELRIRTLTRRERELLGLLANGWSNRRIANECLLSLHTVRTRVQNVLVKLGVHSKLEAVAFAFEHGLVLPEQRVAQRPGGLAAMSQAATVRDPSVADWPSSREGSLVLAGEARQEVATVARHHQQAAPAAPGRLDFSLRATRTAATRARRALSQLRLPLPLAFDAQLLVSELVSNSVRHAGLGRDDLIRVTADWSGDRLLVHVRDGGGPRRASPVSGSIRPAPGAESGWGLYVVDRLASRWGTTADGYWFELRGEQPPQGR